MPDEENNFVALQFGILECDDVTCIPRISGHSCSHGYLDRPRALCGLEFGGRGWEVVSEPAFRGPFIRRSPKQKPNRRLGIDPCLSCLLIVLVKGFEGHVSQPLVDQNNKYLIHIQMSHLAVLTNLVNSIKCLDLIVSIYFTSSETDRLYEKDESSPPVRYRADSSASTNRQKFPLVQIKNSSAAQWLQQLEELFIPDHDFKNKCF